MLWVRIGSIFKNKLQNLTKFMKIISKAIRYAFINRIGTLFNTKRNM